MEKEEIFEIIDENDQVIGTAPRSECHSNPDLVHRGVHCWIFNSEGRVLLQQRSMKKDTNPGRWSVSVGGHLGVGEEPDDAMKRETEEELRIKNPNLEFVGKILQTSECQTELRYTFFSIIDLEAADFEIDKEEVEKVAWFGISEAQDNLESNTNNLNESLRFVLQKMNEEN